jgi:hypothetical protein
MVRLSGFRCFSWLRFFSSLRDASSLRYAAAALLLAASGPGCARNPAPELPRFPDYAPAAAFLDDIERRQEQVRQSLAYEMETKRANQLRALEAQLEVWRRMEEGLAERRREQYMQELITERNRQRQMEEGQIVYSGVKTSTERNYAASEEARRAHRQRATESQLDTWRRKDETLAERQQEQDLRERILERERKRQFQIEQGTWAGVKTEAEINYAATQEARKRYEERGAELSGSSWSGVKTEAELNRAAAEAERRRFRERGAARDQSGWGDIRNLLERDLAAMEAARQREEERYAQRRLEAWKSVMASSR